MTPSAFRLVPYKPHFYFAILFANRHNLPGKLRHTGDLVRLADWHHFYQLSCLHYRLNGVGGCYSEDPVIFMSVAPTTKTLGNSWGGMSASTFNSQYTISLARSLSIKTKEKKFTELGPHLSCSEPDLLEE